MRVFFFIAFFCLLFSFTRAQDTTHTFIEKYELKAYAISYFSDGLAIPYSPVRWNKKEWAIAFSIAAAGFMAFSEDPRLRDYFQQNRNKELDYLSAHIFENFGDIPLGLGSMGVIFTIGTLSENENLSRLGLCGIKAFVLSVATCQTVKMIFHRQRPSEGDHPHPSQFYGPGFNRKNLSFYSNHASNAFALASVVAGYYENKFWLSTGVYTLATLTALSRINDDEHWMSDVIIGSAIGYGIGKLCLNSKKWKPKLTPAIEPVSGSLGLNLRIPL